MSTIIDIHIKTEFYCDENLYTIDYPFGSCVKYNIKLTELLINKFVYYKNLIYNNHNQNVLLFCRGSSGAIMGALFAKELPKCQLIYLAKEGEGRHGSRVPSFSIDENDLIVFVDDFIVTGETINIMYNDIAEKLNRFDRHAVDFVCVTGNVSQKDFKFPVKHVICKKEINKIR